jgi:outer membrane protein OmpA-like peptidoglycan-associated protein
MAGEKTEKATPKKRKEAREKGQVARSIDLQGAVVLIAGIIAIGSAGPGLVQRMGDVMRSAIDQISDPSIVSKQGIGLLMMSAGKATLLADSYALLDQVIDTVARRGIQRLRIEGHTDNMGGEQHNLKLSGLRAEAVRDYLVKQGISSQRLEAKGYGAARPIAPNVTNRGREMNRRVEFKIL